MGGACGDRLKTIKTIFVAEKKQTIRQESVFRRTIQNKGSILHELQDGYLSSKPHVEGGLFPLTRALLGLWIFHHLLGGGGGVFEHPPRLSRLLRIVERNGKQRSKAREKSFRNHFGHFLAQVKIEVTRGQNSKIFQNGF